MHRLAAIGCAMALALAARTSLAQEISVANEASLPRVDASGNQLQKRALTSNPERVSDQDCLDDQRIRFTLLLSDYVANATVEAWAANSGQDCSQAVNRAGATQQCWKLVDTAIPLQPQGNIDIPVRRIISGVTPFTPITPDTTANVCGKVGLSAVSVQFLYFEPGNLSQASVDHPVTISVDTINPPEGTTAGSGDGGTSAGAATNDDGGCRSTRGTPLGLSTAVLGIAVAAFVRRRRR